MPEAMVRGVRLIYEVIGDAGPWIALTPGSRRSYDELVGFATLIADKGYRVLLHDRRNCGASEVAFDGSASEHEVWADDLYELARQLDAVPLYVGGSSSGARLAILFAIRHPNALSGMLLWRVTGGQAAVDKLSESYYGQYITMTKAGGMAAVCNSEHFRECIRTRPENRNRLMKLDPNEFIGVMNSWRDRFLASANLPVVGATEAELKAITAAVCMIAGNDIIHAPAAARKAKALIPNSELHDDVAEKRPEDNLLEEWDRKEWTDAEPRMAAVFTDFLKRMNSNPRA
jgi:pimeloyl-ACP methyl ester carboxylesterase